MTSDSKGLYAYCCSECGHSGEQRHADDSRDGAAPTCSACGAAVTLEWDGGVTFETGPTDLREPSWQLVPGECVGGRMEHTMEPEWRGRGFDNMRCRWCGKREPV